MWLFWREAIPCFTLCGNFVNSAVRTGGKPCNTKVIRCSFAQNFPDEKALKIRKGEVEKSEGRVNGRGKEDKGGRGKEEAQRKRMERRVKGLIVENLALLHSTY